MTMNMEHANFRVFAPDETESNRLGALFEVTNRCWVADTLPEDDHLAPDGRVMEMLSEHTCQGWLEGYLLTGRHGFFTTYEAFVHVVDSMFNQHAKWLKVTPHIPWRRPIASLNYLLTSHVWRQDHNGFSHQDPGFIDHVVNKKAEVIRVYFPPDANCLLSVADHCLRSRHYVNVIVAGKQPALQYLDMDAAIKHCTAGIGIWEWATNDRGSRAGRGHGLLRRRPDARDARRGRPAPRTLPGAEDPRDQRRRPDAAAARERASARPVGQGVRQRCSRPTSRSSSPSTATRGSSTASRTAAPDHAQPPRPRVQGGGHDHDAVRHGRAQRPRPLPPRRGRDRPGARSSAHRPRTCKQELRDKLVEHNHYVREARRRHARDQGLDVALELAS